MTFGDSLRRLTVGYEGRTLDVFARAADAAQESIVMGSPVTGAPGQPVDTNNLRASWQPIYESASVRSIVTKTEYALAVEDGVGSKGQSVTYGAGGNGPTPTGGSHSLKMTRAGWQRLLDKAAVEVNP